MKLSIYKVPGFKQQLSNNLTNTKNIQNIHYLVEGDGAIHYNWVERPPNCTELGPW